MTPSILTQMNGTDATVVCTVSGNPIPELRWNTNLVTISEVIISIVNTLDIMNTSEKMNAGHHSNPFTSSERFKKCFHLPHLKVR